MTHDFDDDFKFSTTTSADALVRRACHRLIANCCGVTRASPAEDRAGVDYWVILPRGRAGLDAKLRAKDFAVGRRTTIDCVLELDGYGRSGWLFKSSDAQLILFACTDTHRVALFEKHKLQLAVMQNVSRWLADGRAREITTESQRSGQSWKNRAVIVSAELLMQAIERLEDAANDGDRQ
jgi:hypothetical protein